ncbi:GDNF family receptor alpha-1-like [Leptodactylus fuscus]|uniref:GDNF family receptor alpha-1-like n=1 Tax=Leptodactylus fuscus TaxID=238119 RepID=UPI003F4F02F6
MAAMKGPGVLTIQEHSRNAIQAFGNGTDVKLQPDPAEHSTTSSVLSKSKTKDPNFNSMHFNEIPTHNGLPACANLIQAQKLKSNNSVDSQLCLAEQSLGKDNIVERSSSGHISGNKAPNLGPSLCSVLLLLLLSTTHSLLLAASLLTL